MFLLVFFKVCLGKSFCSKSFQKLFWFKSLLFLFIRQKLGLHQLVQKHFLPMPKGLHSASSGMTWWSKSVQQLEVWAAGFIRLQVQNGIEFSSISLIAPPFDRMHECHLPLDSRRIGQNGRNPSETVGGFENRYITCKVFSTQPTTLVFFCSLAVPLGFLFFLVLVCAAPYKNQEQTHKP